MTSPPIPRVLALASVMTPWEVEIIAIPKPFKTLGSLSQPTLTRKPGLEIFFKPEMTLVPSLAYFNEIDNSFFVEPLTLKSTMNPSSFKILAI